MAQSKRDFQELIQQYYSDEEIYYACLGDTRSKNIE